MMMFRQFSGRAMWLAVALVAALAPAPMPALDPGPEPMIRVRLIKGLESITVIPAGEFMASTDDIVFRDLAPHEPVRLSRTESGGVLMTDAAGAELLRAPSLMTFEAEPGVPFIIEGVPYGVGWWWEGRENRRYEGVLTIHPGADGGLDALLRLPAEEYLRGVVPSEIGGDSPAEALKAQAVAARSETLTALTERTYAGQDFDICADVECQVFSGLNKRTDATDAAIAATRGIVLTYDGRPIPAYYASNSGGFTEDIRNVWPRRDRQIPCYQGSFDGPGEAPTNLHTEDGVRVWVESRPEVFSNPDFHPGLPGWTHKNFRWEVSVTGEELGAMVARRQDIGAITAIEPLGRGHSGRLTAVRMVGTTDSLEVGPELAIRRLWEPPLKSAAFVVDASTSDDGATTTFTIKGAGYGHGVGMCQTGAIARALSGQDFRAILLHYYTEAELVSAWD